MTSPNTRSFGRYRVLASIGRGGMGEVFLAEDTKLGRRVAIKVRRETLASSVDQQRFAREARLISSLSHPHICTLFDYGSEGGEDYLVMEYLEGEPLTAVLSKESPLEVSRACEIGSQLADALHYAHAQAVLHRDLKPSNVLITHRGPKLLDFGLAKTIAPALAEDSTVTLEKDLTGSKHAGTPYYMSPEQLDGSALDARSDIFSLGLVLFEMLTSRRPFDVSTPHEYASAIRSGSLPDLGHIRPEIPEKLKDIVSRCLAPSPRDRFESADHVREGLLSVLETEARKPSRVLRGVALLVAAGVIGLLAFLGGTNSRDSNRSDHGPVVSGQARHLSINLPDDYPVFPPNPFDHTLAVSPDGTVLVYVAESNSKRLLLKRDLGSPEVSVLKGTENAVQPFFSPDGEWIAYFTMPGHRLNKVPLRGGAVVEL